MKERRKELLTAYKNRKPDMGVISMKCTATGESFLGISKDTRTAFNGIIVRLNSGYHPNRRLLELWKQYGQDGFECAVLQLLEYDDPHEDHTDDLQALCDLCLAEDPKAVRIWR